MIYSVLVPDKGYYLCVREFWPLHESKGNTSNTLMIRFHLGILRVFEIADYAEIQSSRYFRSCMSYGKMYLNGG